MQLILRQQVDHVVAGSHQGKIYTVLALICNHLWKTYLFSMYI